MVCKSVLAFKIFGSSIDDDPCSGRLKSETNPDISINISFPVLEDRDLRMDDVSEYTGISYWGVYYILFEKICSRNFM